MFWWSHVPRQRIGEFLASLHGRLEPGARVVLMDNRFVEGSSTPVSEIDAYGNGCWKLTKHNDTTHLTGGS